jgi:hypothetical protein
MIDGVELNLKKIGIIGRTRTGRSINTRLEANKLVSILADLLLLLLIQTLLQLDLKNQINRHHLLLRKLMTIAILPVGERIAFNIRLLLLRSSTVLLYFT